MTSAATRELVMAKLASSGLDEEDAKLCGFTGIDNLQDIQASWDAVPGLKIPYFHPCTGEPMRSWPMYPDYYRVRALAKPEATGFDAQVDQSKRGMPKYSQPYGTGLCAYFPPNLTREDGMEWIDVCLDTEITIIITEGELKAAKAAKHGFAAIGLGGVHSFGNTNWGYELLPELELVNWIGRTVIITFDNDMLTNKNIVHALNKLAEILMSRGARPHVAVLPSVYEDEELKTGLDDFLVYRSVEDLVDIFTGARLLTQIQGLLTFNKQYAYVLNKDRIIDLASGIMREPRVWSTGVAGKATVFDYSLTSDGEIKHELVSAAPEWMKWPCRNEIDDIDYLPQYEPRQVIDHEDQRIYNTWHGWGVQPAEGDVTLFKQLCQHLFSGPLTSPEDLKWFYQWLAYPIQHPGTKLFQAVLVWGRQTGTGKSILGEIMGMIYGENYTELKPHELGGNFNEWSENKQFILVNEVEGDNTRESTMIFKNLITQETVTVNRKHMSTFKIKDCINYYFTSNKPNAIILEDVDRRVFVIETPMARLPEDFYNMLSTWKANGGAAALMDWLLKVDLTGFNPKLPAPETRAKLQMQALVKSDIETKLTELRENPDGVLVFDNLPLKADIFMPESLMQLLDPNGDHTKSAQAFGRALKAAGFHQVGDSTFSYRGRNRRLYIVRNTEKWLHATPEAIRKHLDETAKHWFVDAPTKKEKF